MEQHLQDDIQEVIQYLADVHELSEVQFEREEGEKICFTGYDFDNALVAIIVVPEDDKVVFHFCIDGQSYIADELTEESYEEYLATKAGA